MTLSVSVTCGAGSYYDMSTDECIPCELGTHQSKQAELSCEPCPDGTTTVLRGATNISQCIGRYDCVWLSSKRTSQVSKDLSVSPVCLSCRYVCEIHIPYHPGSSCSDGTWWNLKLCDWQTCDCYLEAQSLQSKVLFISQFWNFFMEIFGSSHRSHTVVHDQMNMGRSHSTSDLTLV